MLFLFIFHLFSFLFNFYLIESPVFAICVSELNIFFPFYAQIQDFFLFFLKKMRII